MEKKHEIWTQHAAIKFDRSFHYVGVSGGQTSAYLLYLLMQMPELENRLIPSFQNTGWEHEASIEFIRDIESYWKAPIRWLEYDFPEGFAKACLEHAPTYKNLEKYGLEGMYKTAVKDLQWRDEWKDGKNSTLIIGGLFGDETTEVRSEDQRDYSRCESELYTLFGKSRGSLGRRFKQVDFDTADRKGLPMLKAFLYVNAFRLCKAKKWVVPNANARWCTGRAKIQVNESYIRYLGIPRDDYYTHLGLRADEPKRVYEAIGKHNILHLACIGVDNDEVKKFWDQQDFSLSIREAVEYGNCLNCHLKKLWKRVKACQAYPKPFEQQAVMETAAGDQFDREHSAKAILRLADSRAELPVDNRPEISCVCS